MAFSGHVGGDARWKKGTSYGKQLHLLTSCIAPAVSARRLRPHGRDLGSSVWP